MQSGDLPGRGATDVAIETGDTELLAALETQWQNMVRTKMYVNGGLGSRWDGESFGNRTSYPMMLPTERLRGGGELAVELAVALATGKASTPI